MVSTKRVSATLRQSGPPSRHGNVTVRHIKSHAEFELRSAPPDDKA